MGATTRSGSFPILPNRVDSVGRVSAAFGFGRLPIVRYGSTAHVVIRDVRKVQSPLNQEPATFEEVAPNVHFAFVRVANARKVRVL